MPYNNKLITKRGIVIDIIISLLFYVFMISVCMNHTPAETLVFKVLTSMFAAFPLWGTSFIALCYFRVTLTDQKSRKRSSN